MNELVKIQINEAGQKTVSARNMYLGLGLEPANWRRWATKNIEKNPFAVEGVDWVSLAIVASESENVSSSLRRTKKGFDAKDYVLILDFAKKLSMQVKTQRGEDVRNYFIEAEKVAIHATQPKMIDERRLQQLEQLANRLEARMITSEVTDFSVHGYCGLYKIKVSYDEAQALGKLASKKCREQNQSIGKIRDFRFGMVNLYPEHILKQAFEEFFKQPRF